MQFRSRREKPVKLFLLNNQVRFNILLKLVRTPLNVLLQGFWKYLSLSLYAPITSDEYHAWFHLNAASPAAMNTEQVNITENSYPHSYLNKT